MNLLFGLIGVWILTQFLNWRAAEVENRLDCLPSAIAPTLKGMMTPKWIPVVAAAGSSKTSSKKSKSKPKPKPKSQSQFQSQASSKKKATKRKKGSLFVESNPNSILRENRAVDMDRSNDNVLRVDKSVLAQHKTSREREWLNCKNIPSKLKKPGVDMTYVVSLESCPYRWEAMQIWAYSRGIPLKRWKAVSFTSVDFDNPPLPVINLGVSTKLDQVTKGQVGCTMTHLQIWRDAWEKGYKRILVLEDDVILTDSLLRDLPGSLNELEAIAKRVSIETNGTKPPYYHFLYLRRYVLNSVMNEKVFGTLSNGRTVTRAVPSWGSAAYILTRPGIEWMLSHLTYYSYPLDVQISEYQTYRPDFIALSLCKSGWSFRNKCPENVIGFTKAMRGKCTYSASQAGGNKFLYQFPHLWLYDEGLFNKSLYSRRK